MELSELYRLLLGILVILIIIGMYQSLYMLNKALSSKSKRNQTVQDDISKYGSCCGNTESCTLDAKINDLKKQIELSLPESIIETSAGGKVEKVDKE
jgi:hypothetical protein